MKSKCKAMSRKRDPFELQSLYDICQYVNGEFLSIRTAFNKISTVTGVG